MRKGHYIDYSGKKFNMVTLVSLVGMSKHGTIWNCVCDCGKKFQGRSATLKTGHTKSCGCLGREKLRANREKHGLSKTIEYKILKEARFRAKKRSRPFNLEISDIVIPEICPIFGMPLKVSEGVVSEGSPSIDCFYPEKGYTKGNIWIISKKANSIKSNLSLDDWKWFVKTLEERWQQNQKIAA
jgi:hypothetical protein